jgi:hypothetical protein
MFPFRGTGEPGRANLAVLSYNPVISASLSGSSSILRNFMHHFSFGVGCGQTVSACFRRRTTRRVH